MIVSFPLQRLDLKLAMRLHPFVIGFNCSYQLFERGVEIIGLAKEDPIEVPQASRRFIFCDVSHYDGNKTFAHFVSMFDLSAADLGPGRIWTDEKENNIRLFNAFLDLLPPIYSGRDTFPVNPYLQLLFVEGIGQSACSFNIFPRIGDKQASHELTLYTHMSPCHSVSVFLSKGLNTDTLNKYTRNHFHDPTAFSPTLASQPSFTRYVDEIKRQNERNKRNVKITILLLSHENYIGR